MKITVYYEDNRDRTTIEVPDEDCEIWVENDYQQRLTVAEDKSTVSRRTPQQIMDEECNRPTYNSQHAETRRHISLDCLDPMGDTLVGSPDIETDLFDEDYAELYRAIEHLLPRQKELLLKVFWEDLRQVDIARSEGVSEPNIPRRLTKIYARLKKELHDKNYF